MIGKGLPRQGLTQNGSGLPMLTKICARGAKPIGEFGLVYQRLPFSQSGSPTILVHYYQRLPAAELNTHTMISSIVFWILIVGLLAYASYLRNTLKRK